MSARSNPLEELERLFRRMRRQFDGEAKAWDREAPLGRERSDVDSMAIDLVEHDDEFVVTVDLPGFDRDEVDVQIAGRRLRIEARREETTDETSEQYLRHERRRRAAERSVSLPGEVDPDGVDAQMRNGVLTIRLPKSEPDPSHTIEIDEE